MTSTNPITIADVEEALQANQKLQTELQLRCKRLHDVHDRIASLRSALFKSQNNNNNNKVRRRFAGKRHREDSDSVIHYLNSYGACSSGSNTIPLGPFRDAGIYAEGNIPRYADIPLTIDELRWQEVNIAFPQITLKQKQENEKDSGENKKKWGKVEDDVLTAALRSYAGRPCGPSFWKSLALPGMSQFDIACKYVALQLRKKKSLMPVDKYILTLSEEELKRAAQAAVGKHLGDLGAMFAAYAHHLTLAARRQVYLAEIKGCIPPPFPPYVWVSRINFQRTIIPIVREAKLSIRRPNLKECDEMSLSRTYSKKKQNKPSLLDLTVCLIAFKSGILGEKCGIQEVIETFLPQFSGNSTLTLRDILELKI